MDVAGAPGIINLPDVSDVRERFIGGSMVLFFTSTVASFTGSPDAFKVFITKVPPPAVVYIPGGAISVIRKISFSDLFPDQDTVIFTLL